jgi:hypothetical protein
VIKAKPLHFQMENQQRADAAEKEKSRRPGVDVMVAIFDNYRRKQLVFFSKTNALIKY